MRARALLLAGGLLCGPSVLAGGFEFSLNGGMTVPILSDAGGLVGDSAGDTADSQGVKVDPFVLLEVETPLSTFSKGPRLVAGAEYGSIPGVMPDIAKPETFHTFSMRVGVHQTLSDRLLFGLYAECGFTTRLGDDPAPLDRAPRYCGAGVRIKGEDSELAVTVNADQRLASTADLNSIAQPTEVFAYQATVSIRGRTPIPRLAFSKVKVSAYVQALLGMEFAAREAPSTPASAPARPARHDIVNVGILVGI